MMHSNPLVIEVLSGLTRQSYAQLYYLSMLALQGGTLFVLWPKGGIDELLANQHSPYALAAVVMAMGLSMAYFALRAGLEDILLPGQHGLRDWALATPLRLGRVMAGYVSGQIVHSVHQLALTAPLLLMAFTLSGGEWPALGWCVAAALIQALFYRLCGAITHLTIGQHKARSLYTARTVLVAFYVPLGWFVPATSHVAFTYSMLGEPGVQVPDPIVFLGIYAALSAAAALIVYWLLLRSRGRMDNPPERAGLEERSSDGSRA